MFFNNAPKQAVAYVRVSSATQEEKQTIDNQIEFATNYCKLNSIELQYIYRDDGVSGTLPLEERPAGYELLQDARKEKFSLVLLFKLDRLGRATRVILNAVHELDSLGVKVRSMTEPFDTSDASGRFLLTILAGVADLERSNILQRMELGATRAAKEGKFLGGHAPYGYKITNDGFYEPNYEPIAGFDMSEVDVVRMMFDMILQGKSTNQIAVRFNNMGIPVASEIHGMDVNLKFKWRNSTVHRMLRSPTYKGVYQYGTKKVITSTMPAIIPEETWEKVQERLAKNRSYIKGNVKHQYLLRGLIKCKHCGKVYTGSYSRTNGYYIDTGRHNYKRRGLTTKCFGKTISLPWIESKVWEYCLEYIRNPQLVVKSIEKEVSQSEKIEKEISLIRSKIVSNGDNKQRLIDLYKNGLISMEDVSVEFEKVKQEKENLETELSTLQDELHKDKLMRQIDTAVDMLALLREKIDKPDVSFETKRTVVETMIDRIILDSSIEDKIKVTVIFRFGETRSTSLHGTFSRGCPKEEILNCVKVFYCSDSPIKCT